MVVGVPAESTRGSTTTETTARQTKGRGKKSEGKPAKPKQPTIGKGKRCYVEKGVLIHKLDVGTPAHNKISMGEGRKFRFFGVVTGVETRGLYRIAFDQLQGLIEHVPIARKAITVLAKGEEEAPYSPKIKATDDMIEACSELPGNQSWCVKLCSSVLI